MLITLSDATQLAHQFRTFLFLPNVVLALFVATLAVRVVVAVNNRNPGLRFSYPRLRTTLSLFLVLYVVFACIAYFSFYHRFIAIKTHDDTVTLTYAGLLHGDNVMLKTAVKTVLWSHDQPRHSNAYSTGQCQLNIVTKNNDDYRSATFESSLRRCIALRNEVLLMLST